MLNSGVDERLSRPEVEFVSVNGTEVVLLIRIASSTRAPHMVTRQNERKCYVRTNSGKEQMSISQIRDAVLRTSSIAERVQEFVHHRVEKWRGNDLKGAFWMMHVIPLNRRPDVIDLSNEGVINRLQRMIWPRSSDSVSHCLDGYKLSCRWPQGRGTTQRINFRDGTVELLDNYAFDQDKQTFSGIDFVRMVHETFDETLNLYRDGTLQPPIAFCLSLGDVRGFTMGFNVPKFARSMPLEESTVLVDPVVLTALPGDESQAREAILPAVNIVWNAFGYPKADYMG